MNSFMETKNNVIPEFWRTVTDEQIENALKGTLLGQIYDLLQRNYAPKAPVSICLTQAIVNMSMALVHKRQCFYVENEEGNKTPNVAEALAALEPNDPDLAIKVAALLAKSYPAHKSGIYIDTKTGNVPNVYALTVAPSGFGKSLSLSGQVRPATGFHEVSDATLCGIYEEAVKDPHILISFQEFAQYLKSEFAVSELRYKLTDMFSSGGFYYVKGNNGGHGVLSSEWFYPILTASIQPEVLKARASQYDISQGLLPRFLVCYVSEEEAKCHVLTNNICNGVDFARVILSLGKLHQQEKVVRLPSDDYNVKFMAPIESVLDPKFKPFLNRYASEYLPRIALMLAIPADYNGGQIPDITEEHMQKAALIMHRYLFNVERAFTGLNDLSGSQKQFEGNLNKMVKIMDRLHKKGEKKIIKISEISRASSGTGWSCKTREEILAEMLQRGWIKVVNRKTASIDQVQRGDKTALVYDNIPEGIL